MLLTKTIKEHKQDIAEVFRSKKDRAAKEEEMEVYKAVIESVEWSLFKLDWWHKPIISCAACMCSFHGILISTYCAYLTSWTLLFAAPIAIMGAVVITVFTFKKYENGV
jgi:hypothetical protein